MTVTIRDAVRSDAPLIVQFIEDLADYEKLRHEAVATVADIERELFGPSPKVFCQIAEWGGRPAGFALWFYTFSTFLGRHGIWLEDLFVRPAFRGRGHGLALLNELRSRTDGRVEWSVLDWNESSIRFYESLGARPHVGWTTYRWVATERQ